MLKVQMHDTSWIGVEIHGAGPCLLLPVNPRPAEGPQAEEMMKWGVDPALGRSLIERLSGSCRVIAFDYEGHVQHAPKPDTLTPDNISRDFLAIADAASAQQFAYYGYSWLALCGMQLAQRTNRLSALAMGGFPPVDGPYKEMLRVTLATHELAQSAHDSSGSSPAAWDGSTDEYDWSQVEVAMSEAQARQFVTLYQSLQAFDDRAAQAGISCPRLCFAGSADLIEYGERWGDVRVDIAGPLIRRRAELEALGWEVEVLEGLDHTQAMQAAHVLPLLRPWLDSRLLS
ncbi:alpha/beta fold hydrolase [Paenibacillus sp. S150]|uniref:alpha/beta fold hydrolase n=1 Tax=Paenibacillus sp. S150 TaxID=2749826 RepID=UPI001C58D9FC|nr:alpha/beta hydrolase [Paenibacillus sp. S150]MBW4084475.1 alpha/beta hydrolase [Paenibacillus sp. S150]